ncbi:conserved phage C-terminal domain-containing protein [Clostridium felsineum]|uniref:conserved phage C-terminal domain-containing protein n=1 Tax=Clostridium felsineum TaxID=36839 RepID=UPI00214D14EC|nr:conserved phage C-terminal domain-containing protein [Clostridium felsineum]
MKYTINGFCQKKLIEFGLDAVDSLILRYFVDFKDSLKMVTKTIQGKTFYWVKYESINEELPVLKLKKDSVYRRLKNMCECEVLERVTVKDRGTYSFYKLGNKYTDLITDVSEINPNHVGNKSDTLRSKIRKGTDLNPEQNINLLKDKSIKDIYYSVVGYLNEKIGSKYKSSSRETQKFIHARIGEGFTIEDFKTVIDKKAKEWIGTSMERYLRPSTLFGTKFESYLNQTDISNIEENKNNDNTYNDFNFDFMKGDSNDRETTTS